MGYFVVRPMLSLRPSPPSLISSSGSSRYGLCCQVMATLTISQIRHCCAGRWSRGDSNSSQEVEVCVCVRTWLGSLKGWDCVTLNECSYSKTAHRGPSAEGHTVKGHYISVVRAFVDTLHLHPPPLCLPALFPCRGWSPETRLGLIYSPSLLSPAWLPLQWRNFLSPSVSLSAQQ